MKSSTQICFLLVNLALVASLPIELISTQIFNVWSYEDYLKQLAAHQDETANDIEADDISQPWDHPVLPEERYEILVDESSTEHDEPPASPKLIPATAREEAEKASADAVILAVVTQEPVVAAEERSSSVTQEPAVVAEDRSLFVTQEPNVVFIVTDNAEGSGYTQDTLLESTNEGSGLADFEGSGSSASVLSDPTPSVVLIPTAEANSNPDLTQTVGITSLLSGSELKDEFGAETTTTSSDSELKETLTTLFEDALVPTTAEPVMLITADDSLPSTTQNPIEASTDDSSIDQTTTAAVEVEARSNTSQDEATIQQDTTIVIDSTIQMTTDATVNEPTDLVTAEELLVSTNSPTEETTSAF